VEAFFSSILEASREHVAGCRDQHLTSILGRMAYEFQREITWMKCCVTGESPEMRARL